MSWNGCTGGRYALSTMCIRVGQGIAAAYSGAYFLRAHHVASTAELTTFWRVVTNDGAVNGFLVWLLYLALEPWVRRRWPQTMISWSRYTVKGWRDPLVGRDLLYAVGIGALLYMTDAQDPNSYYGKVLRLNDDGSAPRDNPFSGLPGYKPELYALGIRNAMGLYVHPGTGELWETENGPQGGDEINIIRAGKNYGWPVISYGRAYTGELTGGTGPTLDRPFASDMEQPWLFWSPSISTAAITFYTGNRFPDWKGNIFVGGLVGTQLQRIVLSPKNGLPIRRQAMLTELKQRIREVRQGPDELLYLLTDEDAGALLRLEPVETPR